MFDKGTNPLAAGDILNALEAALYRGRIGRRRFMQLALATGASLSAVRAMAQEGGDAAITQLYNAQNLADSYDYIVVGSGSGGATVAGRLGETGASVLVLEAGDTDQIEAVLNPAMWPTNLRSERDWGHTADATDKVNGRQLILPMGKVVGGGSSINVQIWARGHKNDFDMWAAEAGDDAWTYDNVLEIYKRIEDWQGTPDADRRGSGGRVWVEQVQDPNPVAPAMLTACEGVGIPAYADMNGVMMEREGGAALANVRIKDGRRVNVPQSYLYPVLKQGNVTLLTGTEATTLIMEGTTCKGVNFVHDGQMKSARATRVILAAGAINTPKMLMLSGIGPKEELDRIGVETRVDLPGVGQNFQDHVLVAGCIWEYKEPLPPRNSLAEATFFWKSDSALDGPDMQPFQIEVPYATEVTGPAYTPPAGAWTLSPGLVRPKSRGRVYLESSDPMAQAKVDAQFLSHPDDLKTVVHAIELCREIGNSDAMKDFVKREVMPGTLSPAEMQDFAKNAAGTYFHQSCTCKMGRDEMSVVDGNLSVYGVEGLTIADASIMPRATTGNTMAPTVMIGERAADILLA
ncbi:GMC family oxidoreductase [uncultured Mameliella sp.]|uniref:GMC family oxidoreductase n=1 Tax=uncultured Mameliella sp. TaxID=1447087 RepID=UPI002633C9EE|nr:GMC family oxidoreductase N-terminal domain-containing protein [uncultured Mameliella sp.]